MSTKEGYTIEAYTEKKVYVDSMDTVSWRYYIFHDQLVDFLVPRPNQIT